MSRVPVTVLTGFLGAGKTTLLRSLLTQADGRRIAVIVNEFGDAGFDGGLVEECAAKACAPGDIVELTNGCICCTVADDFIPTMDKLLARDRPLDAIVIETSGLALPQPLLKAFDWPAVRTRATVDGVVTVVDALALSEGRVTLDEPHNGPPMILWITTIRSKKYSRTSLPAPIWWCSPKAIWSRRKPWPGSRRVSNPSCGPASTLYVPKVTWQPPC